MRTQNYLFLTNLRVALIHSLQRNAMSPSNKLNRTMKNDPQPFYIPLNRRRFFKAIALASAGFTLPGYMAEALTLSPTVTQGPWH